MDELDDIASDAIIIPNIETPVDLPKRTHLAPNWRTQWECSPRAIRAMMIGMLRWAMSDMCAPASTENHREIIAAYPMLFDRATASMLKDSIARHKLYTARLSYHGIEGKETRRVAADLCIEYEERALSAHWLLLRDSPGITSGGDSITLEDCLHMIAGRDAEQTQELRDRLWKARDSMISENPPRLWATEPWLDWADRMVGTA